MAGLDPAISISVAFRAQGNEIAGTSPAMTKQTKRREKTGANKLWLRKT
jgi:hypothetical protein